MDHASIRKNLLIILFLGLILRIFLIGNTGFIADISFWKSWSLAAVDGGIHWAAHNTNSNYPPGFLYVLWAMGKIYSFMGNPHDYYDYWRENNFGFLVASKSIPIAADIAIALLIYWFASRTEKLKKLGANISNLHPTTPLLLAAVFYLSPIVWLDSAWWGQVEPFGMIFTLLAIVLLFYKRPILAAAIFAIGPMMKLQNIIYIPIFYLFIARYYDFPTMFKALAATIGMFFLINLPFVIHNDMQHVLYLLTVNNDYFPWMSLNAHNPWWIVSGANGMKVSDKIMVLGILNAKTVGLVLFSISYLLCCMLVYLKPTPRNFLISLTTAIFAFFLFTTESHERYSYPVIVLLLFFYPFLDSGKREASSVKSNFIKNILPASRLTLNARKYFWFVYILFTISIFYNMHTGLVLNYPQNGFGPLTMLAIPPLSIFNSYIMILLFFLLLPFIFSQIHLAYGALCLSLLVLAFIGLNADYIIKGEVRLTKLKPIIQRQDFGSLQKNMTVSSYGGWKTWNRLSNNYYYYRNGFGTHANANQTFDINRKFRRFTADVGLDTESSTDGTVIFKVVGDGRELYATQKKGRFDYPSHIDVDITGVKYLGLIVEDAGDGINNDHADWLNPILYK